MDSSHLQRGVHCSAAPRPGSKPHARPFTGTSNGRSIRRSVAVGSATAESIAVTAKKQIELLAGSKHGLDKSAEVKESIVKHARDLEELKRIDNLNMTGSRWRLVFTESTASSSGKIGPFIGRTEQEFPADKPGQYINWLYLGPVTASLLADYKQTARDSIEVSFVNLHVEAGPFKWTKEFTNTGTWDSMYIDDEMRVFTANKKNLFVLKRM